MAVDAEGEEPVACVRCLAETGRTLQVCPNCGRPLDDVE